ncbi:MAG: DUF4340 domain-containing protein [Lachnoclostridium sp.]|jgi:hypothetical protein|nr:DUF4340 domain-containing protein [Lachnoclostridium sp.]
MSKKKKQWLLLGSLLFVIAAMIIGYRFIPEGEKETEEEITAQEQTTNIASMTADSIQSIEVKSARGTSTFVKENNVWSWSQKKDISLNTETMDTFTKELEKVDVTTEIDYDETLLEDYGLKEPDLIVTVTQTDGKETIFSLGTTVPSVGGYYSTVSGREGKIINLPQSFYDTFSVEEVKLYQKDIVPTINANYVTGILVNKTTSGELFEAKEVSDKEQVEDYSSWNITKPYPSPAAFNPDMISELQTALSGITLGDLVEYDAKDMSKYGLDKKKRIVSIDYFLLKQGASETTVKDSKGADVPYVKAADRDKQNLKLYIGTEAEDNNYYVALGDSSNVHLMAKTDVNKFIEPDVFGYADHSIYATLATKLKGFDVTIGKTKINVKREPDGSKSIWYLDGKRVAPENEEEFLMPYSNLFLLEYSGVIDPKIKPSGDKPKIEIVYHEDNKDITIKYLPYDNVNFYRVEKDGNRVFLTDMRAVDDVITRFLEMAEALK